MLPADFRATAVITSPPYPNRLATPARPAAPLLLRLRRRRRAVGRLETEAIGGTWGKATSVLAAGVSPANPVVASLLAPYTRDIGGGGPLMASYVTKYFNDLYRHAAEVAEVCADRCRLAYVVGNSQFYGQPSRPTRSSRASSATLVSTWSGSTGCGVGRARPGCTRRSCS